MRKMIMSHKKLAKQIFNVLLENGFVPYGIAAVNGQEKDSVWIFSIRGMHGWRFGMWLDATYDSAWVKSVPSYGDDDADDNELYCTEEACTKKAVQFFAQHLDNWDKFKPSTSQLITTVTTDELLMQSWGKQISPFISIVWLLQYMRNNPVIAYVQDAYYKGYSTKPYLLDFARLRVKAAWRMLKSWKEDACVYVKHRGKVFALRGYDIVERVEWVDEKKESPAYIADPRYRLHIVFKRVFKDAAEQDEAERAVYDRWFKDWYADFSVFYESALTSEELEQLE